QAAMRTTILAGLLQNVGRALKHGAQDVRLYELGRVYLPRASEAHPSGALAWPVDEPRRLGLAAAGHRAPRSWAAPHDALDFYDLKGAADDLLAALDGAGTYAPVEDAFLRSAVPATLPLGRGP